MAHVGEEGLTSALIVAKPSPLRDGLRVLMDALPQVHDVEEADDLSLALKNGYSPHWPSLVLLDAGLTRDEVSLAVRRTKAKWPQARCVVLVDDVRQQHEAESAGADAVLLKGFPAARLVARIVKLLPRQ